jgi:putative FmdB family regulatory protein
MPTYDYACKECGHEFEAKQRMSEDALKQCPECKQDSLKKVIKSTSGFQLKGSGWFKSGGY